MQREVLKRLLMRNDELVQIVSRERLRHKPKKMVPLYGISTQSGAGGVSQGKPKNPNPLRRLE